MSNAQRVAVPEPSPQAMEYYRSGNVLWIVSQATALAIPALVLLTGLSARIRNLARRVGRKWFFIVLVYFVLYSVLQWALQFPLAFYAGYVRQHAYGLSNQTFLKWLRDALLEGAVGLAFGGLLVWLPYWLIRRSPRRWWLYTAILSLPVMFFVMLVEPIWVAPLFNRFGPMNDKQLEARILALADEAGIEGGRVFEVNKSVDTNAVNAYVTGLGSSKRIVLWDTLLAKLNAREVRVVMAHEMGHYVLNHVVQGLLAGFCGILVALYLVYRAANFLLRRYQGPLRFRSTFRRGLAAAAPAAGADGGAGDDAPRAGLQPSPGARGRPLRPGTDPRQPSRRHGIRPLAEREPQQSASRHALHALPGEPSQPGGADRVRQRLSPLGTGRAASLRQSIQITPTKTLPSPSGRGAGGKGLFILWGERSS